MKASRQGVWSDAVLGAALGMLAAGWVCVGCSDGPASGYLPQADGRWAAPSLEDQGLCLEVASLRACYLNPDLGAAPGSGSGSVSAKRGKRAARRRQPRCRSEVCLLPRPLPRLQSLEGWRCAGQGRARSCLPRSQGVDAFQCSDQGCRRQHPRRPDDGEWSCVEAQGAVRCRFMGSSAGVQAGPPDPAWRCAGEGRGRQCTDLSPDLPSGDGPWRCRATTEPGAPRACVSEASDGQPGWGARCADEGACPRGGLCVAGRCLPRLAPGAACWIDTDCAGAASCVLGRCLLGKQGLP